MHFTLFSIFFFFVLTTFVHSAPTAPLDAATLLNNAQEAQRLNAQFQSANGTALGSCNNGDTTCVKGAIASCVNGQFDASKGRCPRTERCFALPSVKSNGTTIACTSEKSAQSLINAAGATGNVSGSGSGGLTSSINPASVSSTLSGATPGSSASETAASNMNHSTISTTILASTPSATVASDQPVATVTVTLFATSLPSVTQTLSPDQASSLLASLLAQGGLTTATANSPSETVSSRVSATATDIPKATPDSDSYPSNKPSATLSSTVSASTTNNPLSASPSTITPVAIANNTGSAGYGCY